MRKIFTTLGDRQIFRLSTKKGLLTGGISKHFIKKKVHTVKNTPVKLLGVRGALLGKPNAFQASAKQEILVKETNRMRYSLFVAPLMAAYFIKKRTEQGIVRMHCIISNVFASNKNNKKFKI